MALDALKPDIVSAALETQIRNREVFTQPAVIDREVLLDGDSKFYGSISDPTVQSYTVGTALTADRATAGGVQVYMDQAKATTVKIDKKDVSAIATPEQLLTSAILLNTTQQQVQTADSYIASLYTDAGNDLGSVSISTGSDAANLITDLINALEENNVDPSEVFVGISPAIKNLLSQSSAVIANGSEAADGRLINGLAFGQRLYGAAVLASNSIVESSSNVFKVMAWHKTAIQMIERPLEAEIVGSNTQQTSFDTAIKSLWCYGAAVKHADRLAIATVTVS